MSILEKLAAVQQEVKAPKNLYNSFGDFKYRSAESILEALKPVLAKNNATIILSDSIEEIGGRVYVKATAGFFDLENEASRIDVSAFAREPDEKKKMDSAQITGTASSYARKYALNGLLLLDDTKDPDTDEYQRQNRETKPEKLYSETIKTIVSLAKLAEVDLGKALGGKEISTLTKKRADELIMALKEKAEKNGAEGKTG